MSSPRPIKRQKLSRQRSPAELAHLALQATALPFVADRWPAELCCVVALLSRAHRDGMKEAKRKWKQLNVNDIARSVELLEAAHGVAPSLGLPWPPSVGICEAATRAGHADVLARAVALGCELEVPSCWKLAIKHGQIEVMAWLRAHYAEECYWGAGILVNRASPVAIAALHGQLAALKWLRSPERTGGPCPWSPHACASAAQNGHLSVLQWLRAQDPPCAWNVTTYMTAARGGHLRVMKWAHAQDLPWAHLYICLFAAEFGHLHVLRWLRSLDPPAPWEVTAAFHAADQRHWDVLRWMRVEADPPCPWDPPRPVPPALGSLRS